MSQKKRLVAFAVSTWLGWHLAACGTDLGDDGSSPGGVDASLLDTGIGNGGDASGATGDGSDAKIGAGNGGPDVNPGGDGNPGGGGDTGGAIVDGSFTVCPTLDSYAINPLQTKVGGTIALSASGSDPDTSHSLTYAWTATGGAIANSSSANTTFTCTSLGSFTLTVTVSNGFCSDNGSGTVTCVAADGG